MPEIQIKTLGRKIDVAVEYKDFEAVVKAAEVLQEILNAGIERGSATVSPAENLAIAGLNVANQLLEQRQAVYEAEKKIQRLQEKAAKPAETVEIPVLEPEAYEALEKFARITESLADRLDEALQTERKPESACGSGHTS